MNPPSQSNKFRIYTIGHSNVTAGEIISLLKKFHIQVLVDVRSSPYSQYNPQFNREPFKRLVEITRMEYLYLGEQLGGRPKDPACYKSRQLADEKADYLHLVDYPAVMTRDFFKEGIQQLKQVAAHKTCAILCSEEDPGKCHRHHLIGRYLMEQGVEVLHIRGDGQVVNARQFNFVAEKPEEKQGQLF